MPFKLPSANYLQMLGATLTAAGAPSYDPGAGQRAMAQGLWNMQRYGMADRHWQEQQKIREAAQKIRERQMQLLEATGKRQQDQYAARQNLIQGMTDAGQPRIDTGTALAPDLGATDQDTIPGMTPREYLNTPQGFGQMIQAAPNSIFSQILKAPAAPTVKNFYEGNKVIQKQWSPNGWVPVGQGPRFQSNTLTPYQKMQMDAKQKARQLMTHMFGPQEVTDADVDATDAELTPTSPAQNYFGISPQRNTALGLLGQIDPKAAVKSLVNPTDRPSLAQQANNTEINSAREYLLGLRKQLQPGESLRDLFTRMSKSASDTGRSNPLYDPQISRIFRTATQRKVGLDDTYDPFMGELDRAADVHPLPTDTSSSLQTLHRQREQQKQPGYFDRALDYFGFGDSSPPVTAQKAVPPKAAKEHLKKHPGLRGAFDLKYGNGAAKKVLGY